MNDTQVTNDPLKTIENAVMQEPDEARGKLLTKFSRARLALEDVISEFSNRSDEKITRFKPALLDGRVRDIWLNQLYPVVSDTIKSDAPDRGKYAENYEDLHRNILEFARQRAGIASPENIQQR